MLFIINAFYLFHFFLFVFDNAITYLEYKLDIFELKNINKDLNRK